MKDILAKITEIENKQVLTEDAQVKEVFGKNFREKPSVKHAPKDDTQVSYAHKDDPKGARFNQYKKDKLPPWAVDVKDEVEEGTAEGAAGVASGLYSGEQNVDESCEICGRNSCTRSFHSLADQEEFDTKTGRYAPEEDSEESLENDESLAEGAPRLSHMGEREYETYAGWKKAIRKAYPGAIFRGDIDIGAAVLNGRDVGEWDGAVGTVYNPQPQSKPSDIPFSHDERYQNELDEADRPMHEMSEGYYVRETKDGEIIDGPYAKRNDIPAEYRHYDGSHYEILWLDEEDLGSMPMDEAIALDPAIEKARMIRRKLRDAGYEVPYSDKLKNGGYSLKIIVPGKNLDKTKSKIDSLLVGDNVITKLIDPLYLPGYSNVIRVIVRNDSVDEESQYSSGADEFSGSGIAQVYEGNTLSPINEEPAKKKSYLDWTTEKLQNFWNKGKDEQYPAAAYAQQLRLVHKELLKRKQGSKTTIESTLTEKAPPGMEDFVLKLKKEYPGHPEKAFATAWSVYNKKHGKTEESLKEAKKYSETFHYVDRYGREEATITYNTKKDCYIVEIPDMDIRKKFMSLMRADEFLSDYDLTRVDEEENESKLTEKSKSKKQAKFMAACAHGADYKSCPPTSVAKEFNRADKKAGTLKNEDRIEDIHGIVTGQKGHKGQTFSDKLGNFLIGHGHRNARSIIGFLKNYGMSDNQISEIRDLANQAGKAALDYVARTEKIPEKYLSSGLKDNFIVYAPFLNAGPEAERKWKELTAKIMLPKLRAHLGKGAYGAEPVQEVAPKGWEGTVKKMKKHKEIDNPWALANYMKGKGYKSHQKESLDEAYGFHVVFSDGKKKDVVVAVARKRAKAALIDHFKRKGKEVVSAKYFGDVVQYGPEAITEPKIKKESKGNNMRNLKESILTEDASLEKVLRHFGKEVRDFQENGELDDRLFDALYDYYFDEMPYGVKKARDGDPYEWISDRLDSELKGYSFGAPGDIGDITDEDTIELPLAGVGANYASEVEEAAGGDPGDACATGMLEGRMSEVDMVMQDIARGERDIYAVLNYPKGPEEEAASKILQGMYDDVVVDTRLHPDDDFEDILDIVADRLAGMYEGDNLDEAERSAGYDWHQQMAAPKAAPAAVPGAAATRLAVARAAAQKQKELGAPGQMAAPQLKRPGQQVSDSLEDESMDESSTDEAFLIEGLEGVITEILEEQGLDHGLDFFFDNGLVAIGKSTARVIINALKTDPRIKATPSFGRVDGEEVQIVFDKQPKTAEKPLNIDDIEAAEFDVGEHPDLTEDISVSIDANGEEDVLDIIRKLSGLASSSAAPETNAIAAEPEDIAIVEPEAEVGSEEEMDEAKKKKQSGIFCWCSNCGHEEYADEPGDYECPECGEGLECEEGEINEVKRHYQTRQWQWAGKQVITPDGIGKVAHVEYPTPGEIMVKFEKGATTSYPEEQIELIDEVDEAEGEYVNAPDLNVHTSTTDMINRGTDLNRPKRQDFTIRNLGNNPMSEARRLMKQYEFMKQAIKK